MKKERILELITESISKMLGSAPSSIRCVAESGVIEYSILSKPNNEERHFPCRE